MTEAAQPTLNQKLGAEALGTFVLVFFGCSAALASGGNYVAIAFAFGLTVVAMAYAVGNISGGHFNPAVSIGAAVAGRLSWVNAGLYAAAQLAGALLAGLLVGLVATFTDDEFAPTLASVSTTWGDGGDATWLAALVLEILATFAFVFIILSVTDSRRSGEGIPAPLVIGLSLTLFHFALIGATGSSLNPARTLGTALFGGWDDALSYAWLYLIAPPLGAVLAGVVQPLLHGRDGAPVAGSGIKLPAAAAGGTSAGATAGAAQTEYPGWKWDAQAQQWVADPATAAATTGQTSAAQTEYPGWKWDAEAQQWVADPGTAAGDATQIRPGDA